MRAAIALALLFAAGAPHAQATDPNALPPPWPSYTLTLSRTEATATAPAYWSSSLTENASAPSDLGAELAALRAAKAKLRRALALVDAIALEHIGEALP